MTSVSRQQLRVTKKTRELYWSISGPVEWTWEAHLEIQGKQLEKSFQMTEEFLSDGNGGWNLVSRESDDVEKEIVNYSEHSPMGVGVDWFYPILVERTQHEIEVTLVKGYLDANNVWVEPVTKKGTLSDYAEVRTTYDFNTMMIGTKVYKHQFTQFWKNDAYPLQADLTFSLDYSGNSYDLTIEEANFANATLEDPFGTRTLAHAAGTIGDEPLWSTWLFEYFSFNFAVVDFPDPISLMNSPESANAIMGSFLPLGAYQLPTAPQP